MARPAALDEDMVLWAGEESDSSSDGSPSGTEGKDWLTALRGAALPPLEQMQDMPAALREEMQRMARRKLVTLLLPRMRLWIKRLRARQQRGMSRARSPPSGGAAAAGGGGAPERCVGVLRLSKLLALFPEDALHRLAAQGLHRAARAGEVVIHEGENFGSGMYALLEGTVQVVKKQVQAPSPGAQRNSLSGSGGGRPPPRRTSNTPASRGSPPFRQRSKSVAPDAPGNLVCAKLDSPQLLGDFTLLTEEPRTASIISVGVTDWVIIPKSAFLQELSALPEEPRRRVYALAFERRVQNMVTLFPMSVADLRRSFLFECLSDSQCHSLLARLQPRCYRKGQFICRARGRATEMFFLRRGEFELIPKGHATGDSTVVLREGSSFGELALFFREKHAAAVRARTHCDVWVLFVEDLRVLLSDNLLLDKLRQTANARRLEWMREQKAPGTVQDREVRNAVRSCPILGAVCSKHCLEEIAAALTPRVYIASDVMVSQSEACDRLMLMVHGRAFVQRQGQRGKVGRLEPMECVGFTCLYEHRWGAAVCAVDNCDCWELPAAELRAILRKHGHFQQALQQCRELLMDPDAQVDPPQVTPPLWPSASEADAKPGVPRWFLGRSRSVVQHRGRGAPESPAQQPPSDRDARGSVSGNDDPGRAQALMKRLTRAGSLAGRMGRLMRTWSGTPDHCERLARHLEQLMNRSSERLVKVDRRRIRKMNIVRCHDGELPRSRISREAPLRGYAPRCLIAHERKLRSFCKAHGLAAPHDYSDSGASPRGTAPSTAGSDSSTSTPWKGSAPALLWVQRNDQLGRRASMASKCSSGDDRPRRLSSCLRRHSSIVNRPALMATPPGPGEEHSILRPSSFRAFGEQSPQTTARMASFRFGAPTEGEGDNHEDSLQIVHRRRASSVRRASFVDDGTRDSQEAMSVGSRLSFLAPSVEGDLRRQQRVALTPQVDDLGEFPIVMAPLSLTVLPPGAITQQGTAADSCVAQPRQSTKPSTQQDAPPQPQARKARTFPRPKKQFVDLEPDKQRGPVLPYPARQPDPPWPEDPCGPLASTPPPPAAPPLLLCGSPPRERRARAGGGGSTSVGSPPQPTLPPSPGAGASDVSTAGGAPSEVGLSLTLRTNLPPPGCAGPLEVTARCKALPQLKATLLAVAAAEAQGDWAVQDLRVLLPGGRGLAAVRSPQELAARGAFGTPEVYLFARPPARSGPSPYASAPGPQRQLLLLQQRCAAVAARVDAAEALLERPASAPARREPAAVKQTRGHPPTPCPLSPQTAPLPLDGSSGNPGDSGNLGMPQTQLLHQEQTVAGQRRQALGAPIEHLLLSGAPARKLYVVRHKFPRAPRRRGPCGGGAPPTAPALRLHCPSTAPPRAQPLALAEGPASAAADFAL